MSCHLPALIIDDGLLMVLCLTRHIPDWTFCSDMSLIVDLNLKNLHRLTVYSFTVSVGPLDFSYTHLASVVFSLTGEKLRQKTGVFLWQLVTSGFDDEKEEEGGKKKEEWKRRSIIAFHGFDAVPELNCFCLHEPCVVEWDSFLAEHVLSESRSLIV